MVLYLTKAPRLGRSQLPLGSLLPVSLLKLVMWALHSGSGTFSPEMAAGPTKACFSNFPQLRLGNDQTPSYLGSPDCRMPLAAVGHAGVGFPP